MKTGDSVYALKSLTCFTIWGSNREGKSATSKQVSTGTQGTITEIRQDHCVLKRRGDTHLFKGPLIGVR